MTHEEAKKFVQSLKGIWRASTYHPMETVVSVDNVIEALNTVLDSGRFSVTTEHGVVRLALLEEQSK